MLTLKLWNNWDKIRLHLARPELKLDGTNDTSERSIDWQEQGALQEYARLQEHPWDEKRRCLNPIMAP